MASNWLDFTRYAVWGLGRSGKAAANLLARHEKNVVASDIRSEEQLAADVGDLHEDVEWVAGENVFANAEVIVTSPGLKPGLQLFEVARQRGIPVISEVDLAFDASNATWVGITGTDGKTTTTGLVGAMIEAAGRQHVVAGNIGTALCDVVEDVDERGVVVAEISANQLWSCHHLAVDSAAITNIADDHLDYFDDFSEYPAAKYRLVRLQGDEGVAVLPGGDDEIRAALFGHVSDDVTWFGVESDLQSELQQVVYFDEHGEGWWHNEDERHRWFDDFGTTHLFGPHNQRNAACAAALARSVGTEWDCIAEGLRNYQPPPHRMQPVGQIDGITYIDDSKATNVHASLAGLEGVQPPLVVIAGGRDKGLDLSEWAAVVAEKADCTVVIGEITDRMTRLLEQRGGRVFCADTLPEAVTRAHNESGPGTTVVLSPACSSYDMFSSYRQRGEVFQKAVQKQAGQHEEC